MVAVAGAAAAAADVAAVAAAATGIRVQGVMHLMQTIPATAPVRSRPSLLKGWIRATKRMRKTTLPPFLPAQHPSALRNTPPL
eukprot:365268-Chlamydomonas_euryale.AAC.1